MASGVTIRVDGLSALGERMRGLASDMQNKLAARAVGKGAQVVKRDAKARLKASPSIDSGMVEKNVVVKKLSKREAECTAQYVVTVKKANYPADNKSGSRNTRRTAGYLELGTVNMPPEPFLGPALSSNIRQATEAMRDALEAGLKKAGK